MQTTSKGGCGSGSCGCGAPAAEVKRAGDTEQSAQPPERLASKTINGITLTAPAGAEAYTDWLELAHTELLRQEAVAAGLLPATTGTTAPELTESDRAVIEEMVDAAIRLPVPTPQECQRFFEANKAQFVVGQAVHVRHILFAVTPGVNVHALTVHAEKALFTLLGKDVPVDQFARLASELSNCPTSAQGGDLGWIGPNDCAPELANELFYQKDAQWGMGVHPRLVHSRFGFHILDVLGRRKGQQKTFEQVNQRISAQLTLQSRAKALHQYMRLLVGQAQVEGIEMEGADSPLVQ
nr:peptidylprolyl isomerase [uncultured Rhodoferax sp.]